MFDTTHLNFAAKEGKMEVVVVKFLLMIRSAYHLTDSRGFVPADYADKSETRDIQNYFRHRRNYDSNHINHQDVENLMRHFETLLSSEDYFDYYNHLNPIPRPNDDELNYLKNNATGMDHLNVDSKPGDELLYFIFALRRLNISEKCREIKLTSRLSKSFMKNIECKQVRIN